MALVRYADRQLALCEASPAPAQKPCMVLTDQSRERAMQPPRDLVFSDHAPRELVIADQKPRELVITDRAAAEKTTEGEIVASAHDAARAPAATRGEIDVAALQTLVAMADELHGRDVTVGGGGDGGDSGVVALGAHLSVSVRAAAAARGGRKTAARAIVTVRLDASCDALAREGGGARGGSAMRRAPLIVLPLSDPHFAEGVRAFARQYEAVARADGADGALPHLVVTCNPARAEERAAFDAARAALREIRGGGGDDDDDGGAAGDALATASASRQLAASAALCGLQDALHLVDPDRRVGCVPAPAAAALQRQLLQRSATCGVRFLRRCAARPDTATLPLRVHREVAGDRPWGQPARGLVAAC